MAEYISKDKFIHSLFKEIAHIEETQTDTEIYISLVLRSVVSEIKKFTPEDVQPIKHGKWMGSVCSACGENTSYYYDCSYCPNCGAKMDG